ncbi:HAD family hydrolase [Streptomyces sp. NPDC092296]|uniref:HAD family hydrolase n=1 Tax=Streptomyces sp. NPDC092296 TaxID=3366012 RepID=UPI0038246A5C
MRSLVLFDLDNTLVDRQLTLAAWAARFRARHGLDLESERWLFDLLADRATPHHFARVRDRFGLSGSVQALWDGYRSDIAATMVCPPEVLSGLERLRAGGWRIGVATNGAADIQRAKLSATGIADRVDATCTSEEAGTRKPDPAVFREAARRCGVGDRPLEGWMVGDDPVNDICGARAVGLRTVWIDRGRHWPDGLGLPDHQVTDARAAIDLLTTVGATKGNLG